MSTDGHTGKEQALVLGVVLAILALVIATGLLLREHAPGTWVASCRGWREG